MGLVIRAARNERSRRLRERIEKWDRETERERGTGERRGKEDTGDTKVLKPAAAVQWRHL